MIQNFDVLLSKEVARVVTLFPVVSCSCQTTGECWHILVAKINLGMYLGETTKVINLTKLRRNNKKLKEKHLEETNLDIWMCLVWRVPWSNAHE